MKIVAITQARMNSTRLAGKVLCDLAGEPMLVRHVNRARRAHSLDEIVVATSREPADDAIADICERHGWPCFRGEEHDVLDRYYRAACQCRADVVVRLTGDCPLIEAEVIDRTVAMFMELPDVLDYVSNVFPERTFPRGLDVEVIDFAALVRSVREDKAEVSREHVTTYILRNQNLFTTRNLTNEIDYSHLRWTVDTLQDLTFVRKIYDHFGHDGFHWQQVIRLLAEHPDWLSINRHVRQKVIG